MRSSHSLSLSFQNFKQWVLSSLILLGLSLFLVMGSRVMVLLFFALSLLAVLVSLPRLEFSSLLVVVVMCGSPLLCFIHSFIPAHLPFSYSSFFPQAFPFSFYFIFFNFNELSHFLSKPTNPPLLRRRFFSTAVTCKSVNILIETISCSEGFVCMLSWHQDHVQIFYT